MRKLQLEELNRDSIQDFRVKPKFPICFVLDDIRSGHNVGSVLRTADAFNLQTVWLTGITPQPPHREILKTAIGASHSVEWHYRKDIATLVHTLRKEGWTIVGIEQTSMSIPLNEIVDEGKVAFIFGNEVKGISDAVLPLLDYACEIPQFGTKHSLNVSVCAGIVGWMAIQKHI